MAHHPVGGHDSGTGYRPEAKYLRKQVSPSTKGTAMAAPPPQDARIRELLLVNLFAVFSERDPERRMRAIVANYTEDVIWSSPEATTRGHEELNAGAQKLIDRTPAFVFTAAGP